MEFIIRRCMRTGRAVNVNLKALCFKDERFLSVFARAMQSDQYRIEVAYTPNGKNEVVTMTMVSNGKGDASDA